MSSRLDLQETFTGSHSRVARQRALGEIQFRFSLIPVTASVLAFR